MVILALESTAKAASVALWEDGRLIGQFFQSSGLTHSRTLLVMAQELLQSVDRELASVDVIATAIGPGSFTGVRIGTAAAKGLAWGADKNVCGVSTLEAMAYGVSFYQGRVCPVMDARRGQVYNAIFDIDHENVTRCTKDRAISLEELAEEAKNDKVPYFLVGDGANLCYNYFSDRNIPAILAPEQVRLQAAVGVAMAVQAENCKKPDDLSPNYLRLSQAERERLAMEQKTKNEK